MDPIDRPERIPGADPNAPTLIVPGSERTPPALSTRSSTRFGKFEILEQVGEGGFGTVYKARQSDLGRTVALKVLHSVHPEDVQRFEREAQTAAQLSHRNIVPIYEVGDWEGRPYIAMQFVEGEPLHNVRLDPRRAIELVREAALAVHAAHEKGIIHRDLKPSNLMLDADRHVRVMDFGLARPLKDGSTLTLSGTTVGTPAYMPPEQAEGRRVDARSDVYSLGATLYELLTGRPPFDGGTPLDILRKVTESDAISVRLLNPHVHAEIETILQKSMEKDPARRYASAEAFAEDLRRHLEGEPVLARPAGPITKALKWVRRHPAAASVVAVVVLASIALAAGSAVYVRDVRRERTAATGEAARAREAEARKDAALRTAQLRRAEGLVAQGDALALAGRWREAKVCFGDAHSAFLEGGASPLAADLGMMDAWGHAPPALLKMSEPSGAALGLAVSGDGRRALSANRGRAVSLWDLDTGREIRRFGDDERPVNGVAISPDGRSFLSGGADRVVRLRDLETGKVIRAMRGHRDLVVRVEFLADGRRALSSSWDRTIRLWDLETGEEIRTFKGHEAMVIGIAASPDGRQLLSASWDRSARMWDVETGREVRRLSEQTGHVSAAAWSPDGRLLLTGARDATLRLWDAETGGLVRLLEGHTAWINSAAFSPDSRRALSGGQDGSVRLWDVETGREIRCFTGHPGMVSDVRFLPDGRHGLSSDEGGTILLWDLDPPPEARPFAEHRGTLRGVDPSKASLQALGDLQEKAARTAFVQSPDGRWAASASWDRLVRVWDVETGFELRRFAGHAGFVDAVAISPDGRHLLSGGQDRVLRLWDILEGREVRRMEGHAGRVTAVAFSPDGAHAASGGVDGGVREWDVARGTEVRTYEGGLESVSAVAFSPDGGRILGASRQDGWVRVWDRRTGREACRFKHGDGVTDAAFFPDGRRAVTGGIDHAARIWDLETGREVRSFRGHTNRVRAVAVSPDGRLVLSSGEERAVKLWDPESAVEVRTLCEHPTMVLSLSFSPDGRSAISASKDREARLVDTSRAARGRELEPKAARAVRALQAEPDDRRSLKILAEWYSFRGAWDRAARLFEEARTKGATVSSVELARCHWRSGNPTGASREFRRALKAGEADPDYLRLCLAAVEDAR